MASDGQDPEEHSRRIRAMKPADRASLAALIRRERDKIPGEIAKLKEQYAASTAWLEEFDPDGDNATKPLGEDKG